MKRKKRTQPKAEISRRPQLSRKKKLLFALIAVPLMLVLLELGLALFGVRPALYEADPYVGFSSYVPLFVEQKLEDGSVHFVTNENKLRLFNRQSFAKEKPAGSYRVFSVGGSTTHGRPYDDATSFTGWLREYLKATCSDREWEVINAGGVSYASYRVALLMEELIRYQPDLFIVYTGHNEFLEERTYGDIKEMPASVQRISTLAAKSRAATLVGNAIQGVASWWSGPPPKKTVLQEEVVTLLDNSVGPSEYTRDDEQRKRVLKHFRYNLQRMIDIADSAGAKVILISPAANLLGAAPFKSEHRRGLTEGELRRFNERYQFARDRLRQGAAAEALPALEDAVAIDDRYALIQFHRGHALNQLGRHDKAKAALARALEEDVCPLRALSQTRKIVEQVAKSHHLPLVDFAAMQAQDSPHRIPGSTVFLDHVHPTIEAHRRLALAILDSLDHQGIANPKTEDVILQDVKEEVLGQIDPSAHAKALMNLSKVLGWAGKLGEAYRLAAKAAALEPSDVAVQYQAGLTAQLTGRDDASIAHYRKAIQLEPTAALVHGNLGVVLEGRGDLEEAIRHFELAIKHGAPKDAERNRRNLARAQQKFQGR